MQTDGFCAKQILPGLYGTKERVLRERDEEELKSQADWGWNHCFAPFLALWYWATHWTLSVSSSVK